MSGNEENIISLRTFYGKPGKRNKNLKRKWNDKSSIKDAKSSQPDIWKWRIPEQYKPSILGPSYCWKTFYRQKEAFDFVEESNEDLHVFAYEKSTPEPGNSGQRNYLATSTPVFWHYYRQLAPDQRHHYEIIPEGQPCHLYFDLEYQKLHNPRADGPGMVDTLIQYVSAWISLVYGLPCGRSRVLDMDASTTSKFSRHLILHLHNSVFEDNVQAGNFVRRIFGLLLLYLEYHNCIKSSKVSQPKDALNESQDGSASFSYKDSFDEEILKCEDGFSHSKETKGSSVGFSCKDSFDEEILKCEDAFLHAKEKKESSVTFSCKDSFDEEILKCENAFLHAKETKGSSVSFSCKDSFDEEISNFEDKFLHAEEKKESHVGFSCKDSFDNDVSMCNDGFFNQAVIDLDENKIDCCDKENTVNLKLPNRSIQTDSLITANYDKCDKQVKTFSLDSNPSFSVEGVAKSDIIDLFNKFSLSDLKSLIVKDKNDGQTLFSDLAVYTRNRNFRLFMSSKRNKRNPLVLASQNTFLAKGREGNTDENVFYASLISHISITKDMKVLKFESTGTVRIASPSSNRSQGRKMASAAKKDSMEGWGVLSPFIETDHFITTLVGGQGRRGAVRHWSYFPGPGTLIYDIVGYRWCGRVEREHRSNNIFYVVDLQKGVYYQKCYDPDCHTYKSEDKPLPSHCLPWNYLSDGEMEEGVRDKRADGGMEEGVRDKGTDKADMSDQTDNFDETDKPDNIKEEQFSTNLGHQSSSSGLKMPKTFKNDSKEMPLNANEMWKRKLTIHHDTLGGNLNRKGDCFKDIDKRCVRTESETDGHLKVSNQSISCNGSETKQDNSGIDLKPNTENCVSDLLEGIGEGDDLDSLLMSAVQNAETKNRLGVS